MFFFRLVLFCTPVSEIISYPVTDRDMLEGENVYSMEEGISVLYVDDEPELLEIARLFLEATGRFTVSTSTSAQDALTSSPTPSCRMMPSLPII